MKGVWGTTSSRVPRPGPADRFGKFEEPPHSGDNTLVDFDRCARLQFEVFEDRVAVGQGVLRPDQPQPHG